MPKPDDVTETDELAAVVKEVEARQPRLSRGQLITQLALEGHRATMAGQRARIDARLRAIQHYAGVLTDAYPPDGLADLRQDWPE